MQTRILVVSIALLLSSISLFTVAQVAKKGRDMATLTEKECIEQAQIRIGEGDPRGASTFYNEIANRSWELKNYQKAIEYYEKSTLLNNEIGNENAIASINSNMGMIYADMAEYDKAEEYFVKSLKYRLKMKEKGNAISTCVNMSVVLNHLSKYKESIERLEMALNFSKEMNDISQIKSCYALLAETYELAGNRAVSKQYFDLFKTFNDMATREKEIKFRKDLEKESIRAQLSEIENKNKELMLALKSKEIAQKEQKIEKLDKESKHLYENYSKQELAIQLLNKTKSIDELNLKKEKEKAETERHLRTMTTYALMVMGVLVVGIFYFFAQSRKANKQLSAQNTKISSQNKEIETQKTDLEGAFGQLKKKNDNITASINYAKIIQTAILPSQDKLSELLPKHFIFFRPRDIVSGDFYWVAQKSGKIILVVADCTGHGVPGALMSMLGVNIIEHVTDNISLEPATILTELDLLLSKALNKKETDNKDGMDISVVCIDSVNKKMELAIAKTHALIIQNGEAQVIKGDKDTVGGHFQELKPKTFTNHSFDLDATLHLYLMTDGYQDQFGNESEGSEEKKFSSKRLFNLLESNHQLAAEVQKQKVEDSFVDWINSKKQIDDVTVFGLTVG